MTKDTNHFPITFSELMGQEKAKQLLGRSVTSNRLAHGYLFKGPEGVGKRLFARSLAAAVNCRDRRGVDACDHCQSCRKYASGNHPDFMVISPEKGTIRINTIREMNKSLAYPPYESTMRVVLLEDVHTMRHEAANCLLKTLEEPPEDNLLILTAESSREILATISSRCQIVPFFSLSLEQTQQILKKEDPLLDDQSLQLLSRLSEGSPGKAIFLKQTEMVEILEKVVAVLLSSAYHSDHRVGDVLEVAGLMADLKEHLIPFLGLLRMWVKDLLLLATSQQERTCFDFLQESNDRTVLKKWDTDKLFKQLSIIDQAEKELNRNCNRSLVCEILLFQLQVTGQEM